VWLLLSHDSRHLRELGLPSAPCRGYEDWITQDRSWKGLVQGRSSARQELVSLALVGDLLFGECHIGVRLSSF
jgi:hypothetical protein